MKCNKCGKRRASDRPCRNCNRIKSAKYQRSLIGKARHRYNAIKLRCARKGIPLEISRADFLAWALASPDYLRIHADWVASNYNGWKTPSVDRIDDAGGYAFGNVQWMTWRDNYRKWCVSQGFDPFAPGKPCAIAPPEEIPDYL